MDVAVLSPNEMILEGLDSYDKVILYGARSLDMDLKTEVKMQKLLFLTMNAVSDDAVKGLDYIPHKKGPYSQTVEQKLEELSDAGLMSLPDCHISEQGKAVSDASLPKKPLRDIIDDFKSFVCLLNEDELLAFIYVTFPEYSRDSEVWDRIRKDRPALAASMLRKGAVSFSKAAEISGVPESGFSDYLKKNGVRWRSV